MSWALVVLPILLAPAPLSPPALELAVETGATGKPGDTLITRPLPGGGTEIVQYPYDPYALKVVLKNVSGREVRVRHSGDPRALLEFVVRKDRMTVSERQRFGTLFSPRYPPEVLVLKPGQSHTMAVSVQFVIEREYRGPGTYQVWVFFGHGDTEIHSRPFTLIVPRSER